MSTINFYSHRNKQTGFLSNFFGAPFVLAGETWPSSEHYFQGMKTGDPKRRELIRHAATASKAAKMGRARKATKIRPDWEQVKIKTMLDACLAKFTQDPKLEKLLVATGDAILIEHTTRDSYWGDGGNGSGNNMLGKVLMEVRTILLTPD